MKPGLAMVVACEVSEYEGRVIRVVRLSSFVDEWAPYWHFVGDEMMEWEFNSQISERCLRPFLEAA